MTTDSEQLSSDSSGPSRAGPTRANSGSFKRPPTTFVTTPIVPKGEPLVAPVPSYDSNDTAQNEDSGSYYDDPEEIESDNSTETENDSVSSETDSPTPSGPTRAASNNIQRPPTTFVAAPITPKGNASVDRGISIDPPSAGPDRATNAANRPPTMIVPRGAPRGRARGGPAQQQIRARAQPTKEEQDLIEKDEQAAKQLKLIQVSPDHLLGLNSPDEIWEKSQFVKTFRGKMNNLKVLSQLFKTLADPWKSELFGSVSPGLPEDCKQSLRNKMLCVTAQLLIQIQTPVIREMIFRHNLLDLFFVEVLKAPPPIDELKAHYLRDLLNSIASSQAEKLLLYLTASAPGDTVSRGSLLLNHFYCNYIAYLFDELVTLEDTYSQTRTAQAPPVGIGAVRGRGAPARARGAPAPRGTPAPRGSGTPQRGRGGPQRGRGGPGGPSAPPATPGRLDLSPYLWTRKFDLVDELCQQFTGGKEVGSDPMISIRSQYCVAHAAHVIQGLLHRSRDKPSIGKLLSNLKEIIEKIFQNWMGIDVFESKFKVLKSVLAYLNKNYLPNGFPVKLLEEAADELIRNQLCKGVIKSSLINPPKDSLVNRLQIFKNLKGTGNVGGVRIRIIDFFGLVLSVRFIHRYENDIISSQIIKTILDLFFDHQHNFFLHETVTQSMLLNAFKTQSDAIFKHLFNDCKLLERIMDNWQPVSKTRNPDPASFVSYNGHLLFLANSLRDGGYLERAQLSKTLPCMDKWHKFLSSEVAELNHIMNS